MSGDLRTRVRVTRAVPFAAIPGFRPLELDLYRPDSTAPGPAVLYVHGGGWRQGTRTAASPGYRNWDPGLFHRVAAAGFTVVSADYRLSGEAVFPAPLADVRRALDWIARSGADHGIDATRVAVWGDSAGGHLAALAALDVDPVLPVRAVVNWYPITDLLAIQADAAEVGGEPHDTRESRETGLLGGRVPDLPAQAREASPVTHARRGAPPFLLVHGTADLVSPYRQSLRLRDALAAAGNDVALHPVDGLGHLWAGADEAQLADIYTTTVAFLHRHAG